MKPIVVVTETLEPACAQWLCEHAQVVCCANENARELAPHLQTVQGLVVRTYTQVNQQLLDQAPDLRVVGRAGVGLENIDVEACRRRGVQVVYTPDANTQAVVEYVFALMFDALRPRYTLNGHISPDLFHQLRREQIGAQLDRLTLGILGFGRIGKRVGQVASAIGMKILVNDLLPQSQLRQQVDYPFEFVDKPRLYASSDVLTIHVDGRATNRAMIDAQVLNRLKPCCLFINAARGMLVDNDALATWARSVVKEGGQAVLDVHEPEPLPADYVFYGLANVRLLPHLASRTGPAMQDMCWVVRDVMRVLQGHPPQYPAP